MCNDKLAKLNTNRVALPPTLYPKLDPNGHDYAPTDFGDDYGRIVDQGLEQLLTNLLSKVAQLTEAERDAINLPRIGHYWSALENIVVHSQSKKRVAAYHWGKSILAILGDALVLMTSHETFTRYSDGANLVDYFVQNDKVLQRFLLKGTIKKDFNFPVLKELALLLWLVGAENNSDTYRPNASVFFYHGTVHIHSDLKKRGVPVFLSSRVTVMPPKNPKNPQNPKQPPEPTTTMNARPSATTTTSSVANPSVPNPSLRPPTKRTKRSTVTLSSGDSSSTTISPSSKKYLAELRRFFRFFSTQVATMRRDLPRYEKLLDEVHQKINDVEKGDDPVTKYQQFIQNSDFSTP